MAPTASSRRPPGLGLARHRRPRALTTDNIQGVTKSSLRKLARKGGVVRIQKAVYTTIRDVIEQKLREILRRIVAIVNYKDKKTATTLDVVYALKGMPDLRPVYGFDWPIKQVPDSRPRARPTHPRTPSASTAAIIAELHQKKAEQQEIAREEQHRHGEVSTAHNKERYDVDSIIDSIYSDPRDDIADHEFDNVSQTPSETNDRVEEWVGNVSTARPNAKLNFRVSKAGSFTRSGGAK